MADCLDWIIGGVVIGKNNVGCPVEHAIGESVVAPLLRMKLIRVVYMHFC